MSPEIDVEARQSTALQNARGWIHEKYQSARLKATLGLAIGATAFAGCGESSNHTDGEPVSSEPPSSSLADLQIQSNTDSDSDDYVHTTVAEIEQFLPLMRSTFPDSPCEDKVIIEVAPTEEMTFTDEDGNPQKGADGLAYPAECRMKIADTQHAYNACAVSVHEYGHLAGFDHTQDPNDIMAQGIIRNDFLPCVRITTDTFRQSPRNLGLRACDTLFFEEKGTFINYAKIKGQKEKIACSALSKQNLGWYIIRLKSRYTVDGIPQFSSRHVDEKPANAVIKFIDYGPLHHPGTRLKP